MNRARALRELSAILRGEPIKHAPAWNDVVTLASEQLVAPHLYAMLEAALRATLPTDVHGFLAEAHRRNRLRNASLATTLADALRALNSVDVVPVLLKGCAMWSLSPPAESDRMISDIDLIISAQQIDAARSALEDAGFRTLEDKLHDENHPVLGLGRDKDAGALDLHLRAPGPPGLRLPDNVHAESRPIVFAGSAALAPTPEAQIVINALHDQLLDGNFWRGGFNLRHMIDAADLAVAPSGVDWPRVAAAGNTALTRTAIAAHVHGARIIAGADAPADFMQRSWGMTHFARQRRQYEWPAINALMRGVGLNHRAWRAFAARFGQT